MERLDFRSFALSNELTTVLSNQGFTKVSSIQAKTIPLLLKKENVLGLAPTGTGKTLAFLVPIISNLVKDGHLQAIIISPTVVLIDQIKSVANKILKDLGYPEDSLKAIKSKADFTKADPLIVVTTLSQLKELFSHYKSENLNYIIIDEGDMVAFDGFEEQLTILKGSIAKGIVSFFSASLSIQNIKRIKSFFNIKNIVDARDEGINNTTISHHLVNIRSSDKYEALKILLKGIKYYKAVLFVSSKKELYQLADKLKNDDIDFLLLSGDLEKREIKKTSDAFSKPQHSLLVASDYASRGLDFKEVDTVISYDLPKDTDYYFHRAGRAGRFYSEGDSFIMYSEDDEKSSSDIKAILRRGVKADLFVISKGELKLTREKYVFKNLGKKDQSTDKLQKQIRHAVMQTKSKKVKPGYKKKVKKAVEKVKRKHRMKVVRTNIAKAGGNAADYHED